MMNNKYVKMILTLLFAIVFIACASLNERVYGGKDTEEIKRAIYFSGGISGLAINDLKIEDKYKQYLIEHYTLLSTIENGRASYYLCRKSDGSVQKII